MEQRGTGPVCSPPPGEAGDLIHQHQLIFFFFNNSKSTCFYFFTLKEKKRSPSIISEMNATVGTLGIAQEPCLQGVLHESQQAMQIL